MELYKISAFSIDGEGGNPAGVAFFDEFPDSETMQSIAADVGFSETAFIMPRNEDGWRVRYFAPESEVPFCGHATIALGAVLAEKFGDGTYELVTNAGEIQVEGAKTEGGYTATLTSPPTTNRVLSKDEIAEILDLFGWENDVLDKFYAPVLASTIPHHPVLVLQRRATLSEMKYDFDKAKALMRERDYTTIMLVYRQTPQKFHVRNAFASGGVVEDPATGAAAAAFTGFLRDARDIPFDEIEFIQGEDMGAKSRIITRFDRDAKGAPVRISGEAVKI